MKYPGKIERKNFEQAQLKDLQDRVSRVFNELMEFNRTLNTFAEQRKHEHIKRG